MKIIAFISGLVIILILFFLAKAFNKPIYNKMHNVWHDDPYGRTIADGCIIIALLIAFLLGLLL
jgi:hypothetical protein